MFCPDKAHTKMIWLYLFLTGQSPFEPGGAGTVYVESVNSTGHLVVQRLTVNNNGNPYPLAHVISAGPLRHILNGIYTDTSTVGGVTWIYQEGDIYNFKELTLSGNAVVAILSDSYNQEITANIDWLWGDKTAVLHAGLHQTVNIKDLDIYLPINFLSYQ